MLLSGCTQVQPYTGSSPFEYREIHLPALPAEEAPKYLNSIDLDWGIWGHNLSVVLPSKSVCTYIFKLDNGTTAIKEQKRQDVDGPKTYYDLQGRRLDKPRGLCIERHADGTSRKILIED